MSAAVGVSVVVPTFGRRASVLRLCHALARQTLPPDGYEVIVSIDGSSDGTREALEGWTSPFRLRTTWQQNRGRAAAVNAGLRLATGDLIVLLDDDMEPAPGLLEAHAGAHDGAGGRGVMGAVPVRVAPNASPASRYVAAKFNRHLENLARPGYALLLTDFYSGNFSVRRDVLLAAGCFDESFRLYGNEDLELSLRLADAGVTFVYEPAALAVQYNDKDFAALARDSTAEGRTAVLLAVKHPEAFGDLKLGTFDRGPRGLRFVRNALLAARRRGRRIPDAIVGLERLAARTGVAAPAFYRLALGYFYWEGVRTALADLPDRAAIPPLDALARELGV